MQQVMKMADSATKIAEKMMAVMEALLLAFFDGTKKSLHGERSVAAWIAGGKDSSTLCYDTEAESRPVREVLAKNKVPYLALANDQGQQFVVIRSKDYDRVREIAGKEFRTLETDRIRKNEQKKQLKGKEV